MSTLEYARPPVRAVDRFTEGVLLLMQVNAMFVFVAAFACFWLTVARMAADVARTGNLDDDYIYLFNYTVPPLLLSIIAWASCSLLRRRLRG